MTLVVYTIGLGLLGLLAYLGMLGLRAWSDEQTRLGRWAREMTRDPVTDQRRGRELLERRLGAPEISSAEQEAEERKLR